MFIDYAYALTFSLPIATVVPYANSLDPDETPSSSASQPDPSCLIHGQYFNLERFWNVLKIAADEAFSRHFISRV